jgi:sugar lactone lactonase YvrE
MNTACHPIGAVVCAGAALLFAASAQAQNLFVTDAANGGNLYKGNVYEFAPGGVRTNIASGFNYPDGLAFDSAGNLFVSNFGYGTNNWNITKITPGGTPSIFALANNPQALAFDSAGNLFVANNNPCIITKITPDGTQSTFVSGLNYANGLAFDRAGNLFVADFGDGAIYKFTPSGVQSTFFSEVSVYPYGMAFNGAGNLFVSDLENGVIYEFTPDGTESIFATGLFVPYELAFDSSGNLFVANHTNIVEITPSGAQSIFASGLGFAIGLAFQPTPELVAAVTNGAIQVAVTMPSPYYSTIVQVSTDMVNWTSVYTNTPPFTYTDAIGTTLPCRFYRALLGP